MRTLLAALFTVLLIGAFAAPSFAASGAGSGSAGGTAAGGNTGGQNQSSHGTGKGDYQSRH